MNIAFPWRVGPRGLTATEDDGAHIRAMIEQLLLTAVGERVNRPDFGGGLNQLVFALNSPELAAALQLTLQAGVQRYLADVVDTGGLSVQAMDNRLMVEVPYQVRATAVAGVASVELPLTGP